MEVMTDVTCNSYFFKLNVKARLKTVKEGVNCRNNSINITRFVLKNFE